MNLGIAGKVAFVSGGSKGMGHSAAVLLGKEGCKVAVVARGQAAIDRTVRQINEAGGTAIGISADLSSQDGIAAALKTVRDTFGPPEIVLSQTNDLSTGRFMDADFEEYERIFRLFTMSTIYLARATIPDMRAKQWGRFVHIGSGTAKEPEGGIAHILHNTIRPSTVGFLKTLSDEVACDGVTVNTIAPGWIETDGVKAYFAAEGMNPEQAKQWVRDNIPIPARRIGQPDEIGGLVAFLCSQFGGYITGEWIIVDGGRHRSAF
jgi:NAD(P)-dependent dehydrogenase (short-subunit alcohol dehydrogenase family)